VPKRHSSHGAADFSTPEPPATTDREAWQAYVHLDSIYSLRQELYSSFPRDFQLWTTEQKATANKITIALNRVAFFVYQGLLEEELVLNENAGTFIWSWERLEDK
jgi:hypothetical protein